MNTVPSIAVLCCLLLTVARPASAVPPPDAGPTLELVGGDVLPGLLAGHESGRGSLAERLPPHLLVAPAVPVDRPGGPSRPHIRVVAAAVRRIVSADGRRTKVGSVRLTDGRERMFRSMRWTADGLLLLTAAGTERVAFDQIAALEPEARDPWAAIVDALCLTAADGGRMLVRHEAAGLVATAPVADADRGATDTTEARHQRIQPAWSLDPLWLETVGLTRRWSVPAHEVPLPMVEIATVERRATFGGSWTPQVNRNVQGGALVVNGKPAAWGFGVQAGCDLTFEIPAFASAFRTGMALDALAGDGGCVTGRVLFDDGTESNEAWRSGLLVGTSDPHDTSMLPLPARRDGRLRLILSVDQAHEGRPAGADPFDIRDIVDWVDPVVILDQEKLRAAITARLPGTIPAWEGCDVAVAAGGRLVVEAVETDAGRSRRVRVEHGELIVARTFDVTSDTSFLVVALSGDPQAAVPVEIRIDGTTVAAAPAPPRRAGRVQPLLVPLKRFAGRAPRVEIVQGAGANGGGVEWHAIDVAGPLASAWEPLEVVEATSREAATLTILEDGSVVVGGVNPPADVYSVRVRTPRAGITGLRLESLRHPSLPRGGPGRPSNNNFVLTDVTVAARPAGGPEAARTIPISEALASNEPPDWLAADRMIDADPQTGWCNTQNPAVAVLRLAEPVGTGEGTELLVNLAFEHGAWKGHTLGCFRLSATTAAHPSFDYPGIVLEDRGASSTGAASP